MRLTDSTQGATIYYHVLGAGTPYPIKYTGPFTVAKSGSVAAYAVAPGYPQASYVNYATFTITAGAE